MVKISKEIITTFLIRNILHFLLSIKNFNNEGNMLTGTLSSGIYNTYLQECLVKVFIFLWPRWQRFSGDWQASGSA